MQNGYTNNINFKIAFTGMMLSLVILFQYLEKFMPIFEIFMKMNLSLVFIMATLYVAGLSWASLLLILRFSIGPAVGKYGYSTLGIWNHTILLVMGSLFIIIFYSLDKISHKIKINNNVRLLIISIISVLIISLIGPLLNGLLFTPVYWYLVPERPIPTASLYDAKNAYQILKVPFFFGIPNYWGGMYAAYGLGNFLKYSLICAVFIPMWKIIKRYERKEKI